VTIVRVKGFKIFPDRHGHLRCYHRASGIPIDLAKAPIGSAEFFAECARVAALAGAKAAIDAPGTLGSLICDYRKSPLFHDLAPRTRADYQKVFDYLRPIADTALTSFVRPLVVRIRDKAAASKGRGFVTLAGFTCFYCLPGESPAKRFQCLSLASPRSKTASTCSV
jgi:hypothetical protein